MTTAPAQHASPSSHHPHSSLSRIHLVQHAMHEEVYYPPHPPRTESKAYKATHHRLVYELDRPCFICGIRNSQLKDSRINVHGVREMETHHLWIEWALADAMDAAKLATFFRDDKLTDETLGDWVDHNPKNLLVLCDRHHRHKEAGIHEVSFPIWVAQKFVRDDYTLTPSDTD